MPKRVFTCKTCGKEFSSKYSTPRTYCSKSCKNKDPELVKKSNQVRKNTNNERYGGHPMSMDQIQSRHKSTMFNKYGVAHALQNTKLKDKVSTTKKSRYGDPNYNNIEKAVKTREEKYGVKFPGLKEYQDFRRTKKLEWDNVVIVDDIMNVNLGKDKVRVKCRKCSRVWKISLDNNYRPSCRVCSAVYTPTSSGQKEIVSYLKEVDSSINVIMNDRNQLGGKEIDIFLPDYNIGFEFNGIYFHSSKFKSKNYHIEKSRQCTWKGIKLFHISEYDWVNNQSLIKSMLKSKLGLIGTKVYGRKCNILEISPNLKKKFLIQNHIQGNARSSVNLGLYHNTDLVAVMTFGKSRFEKNFDYELIRFAVKQNTNVVGGFSKLLSYFKKVYNPKSILSYAKRDYSDGNVYITTGFTFLGFTKPGYCYVKDMNLYPRQKFQKHKLPDIFENIDTSLTEKQIMEQNGFYRLYDSGNLKFGMSL